MAGDAEPASQAQATTLDHGSPLAPTPLPSAAMPLRFSRRALLVTVIGAVVTGGLVGNAGRLLRGQADLFEISQVEFKDLAEAGDSLNQSVANKLIDDAKNCREPLSFLTFKSLGSNGGSIQVLTGLYQSPVITLRPHEALRLALPWPASYQSGTGAYTLINNTDGVGVYLRPGLRVEAGPSRHIINVRWTPRNPC